MRISLCMIVKDEEKYIEKCLESVEKLVDEIIIVDTGSTDNTVSILEEKFGDKIKLFKHKWNNDFSEARNKSLKYATGDWILILDADEKLIYDLEKLKTILKDSKTDGYNIPIYNFINGETILYSAAMVRLFKNKEPIYKGAIHEQLYLKDQHRKFTETLDERICKIFHYGYSIVTYNQKNKNKRNIDIIQSQIKKEPNEPFHRYNLGVIKMGMGKYNEALNCFIKAHELCNNTRYKFHEDLLLRMADIMIKLKDYTTCKKFLELAIKDKIIASIPDFYYYLGIVNNKLDYIDEAFKCFNKCIEIGEVKSGISFRGRGSFLPLLEIAKIYIKNNNIIEGINKYLEAIFNPYNYTKKGKEDLIVLLKEHNMYEILSEFEETISRS